MSAAKEKVYRGTISHCKSHTDRRNTWILAIVRNCGIALCCDRVTMVQAAESGKGVDQVFTCSTDRDWPTRWRVFREPQVRPVLVVVAHIIGHQALQMPLVEHDHVIQQVSATAPHPTLCNTVLPRTAKGSAHRLATHAFRG